MAGLNAQTLNQIFEKAIKTVDASKEEIFHLEEDARLELERMEGQLEEIRSLTQKTSLQVDQAEKQSRTSRNYLAQVSRDFKSHSEEQIKNAYEEANSYQLQLVLLRQREADLRKRRDEVERTILNMKRLVERSEQLLSKMGMAMRMLTGSWSQADEKMKQLDNWQHFGAEIITAQEEERQRIARDLHDGPVQTLAGISMRAEFCQKLLELASGDLTGELVQLQQLSREAIADLRKIIFDLRPMSLDDLGLVPALSRMFERLERNNSFRVDFVIHGNERRLDSSREVAIYRIIQEALNNVQKHAEVNNATVKMEFLHKSLRVQIRDLGCGFNVGKIADDYHGLLTMRERATLIGAELTIKAQPQKGTIVELLVKE